MNLKVGIGIQTNATTKATKLTQLRATESDVKPVFDKVESEDYNGSAYKSESFVATESATGSLTVHLTVETLKLLLDGFGYNLSTGDGGIKETGYTISHIGKSTLTGKIEKYFTIVEQNLENNEERMLTGCQFGNISIEISQGAYAVMTLEVIGYEHFYKDNGLSKVEALSDYDNRLTCIDTNLFMGTNLSAETQSVKIDINQNLEAKYGLGSRKATRIVRNGKIDAKCSLTFNAYNKALYKKGYENLLSGNTAEAIVKMQTKDKKYVGIYLHKLGTSNIEMTDKKGSGGLSQELDIQFDSSKQTPITFAIGTTV